MLALVLVVLTLVVGLFVLGLILISILVLVLIIHFFASIICWPTCRVFSLPQKLRFILWTENKTN